MEFKEHLLKYLNEKEADELIATFSLKEHKGVILHPYKMKDEEFLKLFPHAMPHPIVPHAYLYDQDEYELGKTIYHDEGCFYIQDPSASLVSFFLQPHRNEQVLDMCAAPGGKCVQASFLMEGRGIIYANDLSSSRCEILLSNVERMGLGNVVVLNSDLSKIKGLENSFDHIVLDAPCSGSGMFRKSEAMKSDWTYEKVIKMAHIQKDLITLAYSLLKDGGTLIYSTCSYSFEEDEEVVQYLLSNSDATLLSLPDAPEFYHSSSLPQSIHLFPHKFPGEGHFIALIKKPGELLDNKKSIVEYKTVRYGQSKGSSKIIYNFILPMIPNEKLISLAIRPGLFVNEFIADKSYISHHYSHHVSARDSYALNEEELKKYLHGETLNVKENKNYTTVSYLGNNIGAVYQSNFVLKNLYPKGLRR